MADRVASTDWGKAVSHWLDVWQPGLECFETPHLTDFGAEWRCYKCKWCGPLTSANNHTIPCPPPNPELGFRLLEAMIAQCGYDYVFNEVAGHGFNERDLLAAITKAAAAMAGKDEDE